ASWRSSPFGSWIPGSSLPAVNENWMNFGVEASMKTSVNDKNDAGQRGTMPIVRLLLVNAGRQVFVSSLLGFFMLRPLQPWAPASFKRLPAPRALLPVHLDLYMLAFMQALAAPWRWSLSVSLRAQGSSRRC